MRLNAEAEAVQGLIAQNVRVAQNQDDYNSAYEAAVSRFTAAPIAEQKKRRVAACARVSTDSDEQFTSYEAQID